MRLSFSSFATVGGNFTYVAGTSAPAGGGNVINGFQGTIGGNLTIVLGNGLNTIGDSVLDSFTHVLGPATTIILGNGTNNVTLSGPTAGNGGLSTFAPNAHLTLVFGNGTNTLNLGSNDFKAGTVLFGKGTNTLHMQPPLTAISFPFFFYNL